MKRRRASPSVPRQRLPPDALWRASQAVLIGALRKHPGLGVREASYVTGLAPMTVRAHLANLVAAGKAFYRLDGDTHRHYLAGTVVPPRPTAPLDPNKQALVEYFQRNPGASARRASLALGMPWSSAKHRVARLVEAGRLRRIGYSGSAGLEPTEPSNRPP